MRLAHHAIKLSATENMKVRFTVSDLTISLIRFAVFHTK